MGFATRRLLAYLLCCGACLAVLPMAALAGGVSPDVASPGEPTAAPSPLESGLVTPGSPTEGEQLQAQEEAKLNSPEAVAKREVSQTEFEGLDTEEAAKVAAEAFPGAVNEPAGGPPRLPAGETVTGFPADNAVQVNLGGGRHGVIESAQPIALETAPGTRMPINLNLVDSDGVYQPTAPAVGVRIPKRLKDGPQLSGSGVSLTPVGETGEPLVGSEGVVNGASVLYANTATDQDTLVKPTTGGFEADTLLRSVASPEQLYFRVGLPQGASLVQVKEDPEAVAVMREGAPIAIVSQPSARDAAGRAVPTSMTVSGDTLVLTVDHRSAEYTYPLKVDPTVTESAYEPRGVYSGYDELWQFYNGSGPQFTGRWELNGINHSLDAMVLGNKGSGFTAGEWAYYYYITKGASQVYTWHAKTESSTTGTNSDADMFIYSAQGLEGTASVLPRSGSTEATVCALSGCAVPGSIETGRGANGAFFEAYAEQSGPDLFSYRASESSVGIVQYAGPWVGFDTTDPSIEGYPNPLYGAGQWVKSGSAKLGYEATDPGLGVRRIMEGSWPEEAAGHCKGVQCNACVGAQCSPSAPVTGWVGSMPDGEDAVEATASDGVGLSASTKATVKVDSTPPHNITLTGLPASGEIGDGQNSTLKLTGGATDGGSVASSGVASLALTLDGKPLGTPSGSCAPGPCTATSNEWTVNTQEYAAGKHTFAVTATDKVGNVASASFTLTIHHASPVAMGPGSVNPLSGEFDLAATDVSAVGPGGAMTVGRSYRSRHLSAGAEGPLGPLWAMSVGGEQSIVKLATGSVMLTNNSGQQVDFTSSGGGSFTSPPGDASLSLTETTIGEAPAFKLQSGRMTTTFERPSGSSQNVWMPAITEGTGGTNASTFSFQTVEVEGKKITEPTEELAPVPTGVSCSPALTKGCRALTFNYATGTTATGETASQWGDYNGRLTRVYLTAWDPSKKEMTTTAIAQYSYDALGRLRAQWDPRISPALKTTYGYDAEGHLTAITPPGQESWVLTYGTSTGDPSTGRLLKVMRPQASTPLWSGEAPKSTAAPAVSGTPVMGNRLAVSDGTWTNAPVAYGYQWEECNAAGSECTPIAGATNANYTPSESQWGHTLVVEVTATNGGGSVVAASSPSRRVGQFEEYALPSGSFPKGIVAGPDGKLWFTESGHGKIGKITTGGAITEYAVSDATRITAGPDGNLWFTTLLGTKAGIGKITTGGTITQYALPSGSVASGIVAGPDGKLWFAEGGSSKIGTSTTSGTITEYALPTGSEPKSLAEGPDKNLWFTDAKSNKIGKITTSGTITEYSLPAGSSPYGIVAGPDEKLWFTDKGTNKIGKITTSGTITEYSLPTGSGPAEITVGSDRNLWYTDQTTSKIGKITTSGVITEYPLAPSSEPVGIAPGPEETIWFTDEASATVGKISLSAASQGELRAPQPGTTLEYGVPVSGAGAPYAMGASEVEAWGQKDDPVEATAVFPPDEAQGWPASDYRRATISYFDNHNRAVNSATPGGGIATDEYDATNDVVRSLTADNRAAALHEGANSAEASKRLDVQRTYNGEGTELLSTVGPQHNIKLPGGAQTQARAITRYFYDEGAPSEGGPYDLVTKTIEAALVSGKEEDMRTTTTAYSGQNGLGWKLRKPTETITDPGGLNLVHSVQYEPTTGAVTETRAPGSGTPGEESGYVFSLKFGTAGSEPGQLSSPVGIGIGGLLAYVADSGNNRVNVYTVTGTYNSTFGSEGTGAGQFKRPTGLAVDSEHNIYVADTGNNRIEKFNSSKEYKATFAGTGANQLHGPLGVAVTKAHSVLVADTEDNRIVVFNEKGEVTSTFGTSGASAGQFNHPAAVGVASNGTIYVADTGNNRVEQFTEKGEYVAQFGTTGAGQLKEPGALYVDSEGHVWVTDSSSQVREFSASGVFIQAFGEAGSGEGQFSSPKGITLDGGGKVWVADTGNDRVQRWAPTPGYGGQGAGTAHNQQTIYYSATANGLYPACGEHPEWAGFPCQVQPSKQPAGSIGALPVTTYAYNIWEQPETTTEAVGGATRTTTTTVDAAGRPRTTTVSSTVGSPIPPVTEEYNEATGAPEKQSTTSEGKTRTITSVENRLGQIESYTDADENTSTFAWDIDGRLEKTSDGKGTQTFSYDTTTGYMSKLVDSAAGTFTAARDVEGNLLTVGYPNGMNAIYTLDASGEAIGLEYVKTTHCSEKCVWFSDSVVPSIHGQWLSQTSSLSRQAYRDDAAGRLVEVQDTPSGKGCTTRLYAFDEETNRTSLTTREPGSEGKCATEGGTTESHTYDEANRLDDPGIAYEPFGSITKLPAVDAGGSELVSTFYSNNQLATQTQNGETIGYYLDPAGRTRETAASGKTNSDIISHYSGLGDSPSWTVEQPSGHWTRDITGIDGTLAAVQVNGEAPVLQLPDLHGDIIATASVSETETKLLSTSDTSEYGVPRTTTPPKYSWLGADQRATELPTGVVAMGARSYVPQIGRFLQVDPVEGGSANAYAYTFGDPVNSSDPSGESTGAPPPWAIEGGQQVAEEAVARRAAEEAAARAEAERKIAEEEAASAAYWAYWDSYSWVPPMPEEEIELTGRVGSHSHRATASTFWLVKEATKVLAGAAKKAGNFIVKEVKYAAGQLWADVQSKAFEDAANCYRGATSMEEALGGSLKAWPLVEAFALVVGCGAETQGGEVDNDYVHGG